MMFRYVRFLFLLLCAVGKMSSSQAQGDSTVVSDTSVLIQPLRVEFEKTINDIQFTTINGGEDGLMVVKQTSNDNEEGFEWVIYQLDTLLEVQWEHHFRVPFVYNYKGWDYSDGNYFLLFATGLFGNDSYVIYYLDTEMREVRSYDVTTGFPIKLSHFEMIGETVILAGSANANPAVLTFDVRNPKPRVVPGIYNNKSTLLDLYIDDERQRYSVSTLERLYDRRYTVEVKTFDMQNREIYTNRVAPRTERTINDGAPTQFEAGYQYITGGYSSKSTQFSEGLYVSKFVDEQQEFISYYNFSDLINFFNYLKPRKERRVQSKIEKNRKRGKRGKFPYQLYVHDIIERNDEFFLVGEAYYTGYASYTTRDEQSGGRTVQATIPGYKYSHAIVIAFDRNGQIKWDLSFSLDDIFKEYLGENVVVLTDGDQINLHFIEDNVIKSKIVSATSLMEQEIVTPVKLAAEDEELGTGETIDEGISHWYGKTMYAYGEQDIVKKDAGVIRKNREVYYVNKLELSKSQR